MGKPEPAQTHRVNGALLWAPRSAARVLRRMRYEDRPRILWIDAICINQEDAEERSRQVAIMGHIYRRSTGNLIYLGVSNDSIDRGLQDIRSIYKEMMEETNGLENMSGTMFDPYAVTEQRATSPLLCADDFEHIQDFFDLQWFQYVYPKFWRSRP
jgi:hypothetical protein